MHKQALCGLMVYITLYLELFLPTRNNAYSFFFAISTHTHVPPTKGLQEMKELLVKMEKARLKKPFLGGYCDKQTGQEYHHASAQTLPKRRPDNGVSTCNEELLITLF